MHPRCLFPLVPILALAACGEDPQPTEPTSPAAGGPAFSHAAGHRVVNSAADPGNGVCNASQCTLREAINDAGSTEITFASGLSGPITLAPPSSGGGQLLINKRLRIDGPRGGIVIRRRSGDPEFRILRIGASGEVFLTNLILRNGQLTGRPGGGIASDGTLDMVLSRVEGSSAEQGGGIYSNGPLTLISCTVSGNSARFGGGIDNHGPLNVTHSTIADNSGGGIYNHDNQTLAIGAGSTVGPNSGAGLVNDGGNLTVSNSTISGNDNRGISQFRGMTTLLLTRVIDNSTIGEGGGILLFNGDMTIRSSTIARNSAQTGGGIANRDGSTMTIRGTAIFNNSATRSGGGIANQALRFGRQPVDLTLLNSTISGNSAPAGGGIFNRNFVDEAEAAVRLTNSTVANNSATQEGGGIDLSVGGLELINSLVARNSAPTGPDVRRGPEGTTVIARFNLIGNGSGSGISNTNGNQVGTSSSPIDPRIGPLADNGGPSRTHALLAGSPAIDAASSADCPPRDQRGVMRPQGPRCDIGSYERE
jgi:CSLREA domain-containing protein